MKSLRIVLASLLLSATLIGFSSFVSDSYKENAFAIRCFAYTGPIPPSFNDITDPDNWTEVTQANISTLCATFTTLCVICFDDTIYPLVDGKPSAAVLTIVANNWASLTTQGQEIRTNPGNVATGITVWRKAS